MANKPSRSRMKSSRKSSSTAVRNTAIPRSQPQRQPQQQPRAASQQQKPAGRKEITREQIAKRAFEIHCSGKGGSEMDNWLRAERELRGS